MTFHFENHTLDVDKRELRRDGALLSVEPQVFDLLIHLIRHRDRVVTKDDLIASVWGGRIVSESTLTSRINAARKAIGDTGGEQRLIRTIARKGIRFVSAVHHQGRQSETAAMATPPGPRPVSHSTRKQNITFCRAADGVNLAVAGVGEGPPLVKAANWLTHLEYDWESPLWSPLLHRLAERSRLIRYDGRGNGLSDREVADISFAAFGRDLEAVIGSLAPGPVALLGISQGSAIAIDYAARFPERVSKLILFGAYARGRKRRGSAGELEKAEAFLTLIRHGWGDEHSAFMRAFSSTYLPNGSPEQLRWFIDLQRITTSADIAARIRNACDEIDIIEQLPKVHAPTLVIHCRHDSVVPLEEGRRIATSIPNAKFVTLESDNHVALPDEAAWPKFVREVEEFLAA